MKRIGLIGGMSWESSAEYYRILNEAVRERLAGHHSADCVLLSVDFAIIEGMQAAVSVPLLHLADTTASAVRAAGCTRVGLLGTAFTMEQDFYRERLGGHGLDVLVPEAEDRALVHRVIYEELCLGVVRPESRAAYRSVMGRLVDRGAQGIVLGCTEIELLVGREDAAVPLIPTTRLHALAAVDLALG